MISGDGVEDSERFAHGGGEASLAGLPALRSRWYRVPTAGLQRAAVTAAMYRVARTAGRPPKMVRATQGAAVAVEGAMPTRAILRRPRRQLGDQGAGDDATDAGDSGFSRAREIGAVFDVAISWSMAAMRLASVVGGAQPQPARLDHRRIDDLPNHRQVAALVQGSVESIEQQLTRRL